MTVVVAVCDPAVPVIIVVPAATAEKTPLEFIVPTDICELDQVTLAENGLPYWSKVVALKVVVAPTGTDGVSGEIVIEVKAGGNAETVAIVVVERFPAVTVIVVVPTAIAEKIPSASIVPTECLELAHVVVVEYEEPN